jgi:hypothetical protein
LLLRPQGKGRRNRSLPAFFTAPNPEFKCFPSFFLFSQLGFHFHPLFSFLLPSSSASFSFPIGIYQGVAASGTCVS